MRDSAASPERNGADLDRNARVAALWKELSRPLRAHFQRHVRHAEDAEDLLQEVFLRVHAGLDGVEDEERIGAWIRTIGHRLLVDSWRAARHTDEELEAPGDLPDAPDEEGLDRVVAGWLAGMIGELDEADRDALTLAELEGVPQTEIATRLGLSPSGARSRVQRGRERLRARLSACCEFEFDRRGAVVDWRRKGDPCAPEDPCSESC